MSDRKHLLVSAVVAVPILAVASAAHGQRAETPQDVLAATPAPSAQARVSPLSAFSIEAGKDGATAALKLGVQGNSIRGGEGRFMTGAITFSAPVDDDKGFAAPLTQAGAGAGFGVEVQLSELVVPAVDMRVVDRGPICARIKELAAQTQPRKKFDGCSTEAAAKVGGLALAKEFKTAAEAVPACASLKADFQRRNPGKEVPVCGGELAEDVGGDLQAQYEIEVEQLEVCTKVKTAFAKANPGRMIPDCSAKIAEEYGGTDLAKAYDAAIDALLAKRLITYYGVTGKVGDKDYAFYDPVTLAKSDLDRTPWSAGIFHSWVAGDQTWIVTAEYAHDVSFKEGDKKTACLAGPGPVLSCVSGSLERVKRVTRDVLSLEARWTPGAPDITKAKIGFAPKVTYDANNDDWGVALPVYLFGNKEGLTGGVRADWNSDDHDIVVGVFLTKTLSIADVFS